MNALTRGEGFYGIGSCLQERGYTPLKVIGRGSQGTVTLVKCEQKHQKLVVKQVTMDGLSESEREAALQECRLLHELSHPNIVEYVDSFLAADTFPGSPRCLHLVMQYCEGGDLAARIKYQKSDGGGRGVLCSESQVLDWFCQLALAVDWLHSRRVLHRDIKTSNIFLTERQILKLGDFGISKQLSSTCDKADTVIGTPYYMSPEVFENKPYSFRSDVWACGCVLYEMCTLEPAFKEANLLRLVYKVVSEQSPELPSEYSEELRSVAASMLQKDQASRPSMREVVKCPLLRDHMNLLASKARENLSKPVVGSIGQEAKAVRRKPPVRRSNPPPSRHSLPNQRVMRGSCIGVPRRSEEGNCLNRVTFSSAAPLVADLEPDMKLDQRLPLSQEESGASLDTEYSMDEEEQQQQQQQQQQLRQRQRQRQEQQEEAKAESKWGSRSTLSPPPMSRLALAGSAESKSAGASARRDYERKLQLSRASGRRRSASAGSEEEGGYSDDWDSDTSAESKVSEMSDRARSKTPREVDRYDREHERDMQEVIGQFRRASIQLQQTESEEVMADDADAGADGDGIGDPICGRGVPGLNLKLVRECSTKAVRSRLKKKLGEESFKKIYLLMTDFQRRRSAVPQAQVLAALDFDQRKLSLAFEVDQLVYLEGQGQGQGLETAV